MHNPLAYATRELVRRLKSTQSTYSAYDTEKAWRAGDLSYQMWDVQKKMAEVLTRPGSLKKVLNCSRRLRKTTTALIKATELGLKKEGALMRFAAPTRDMLITIIQPIMDLICSDAPNDLKPIWQSQRHHYLFPKTQAKLFVAGCDNVRNIGRLRGPAADLCVVDEAQEIIHLKYLVDDVLVPQLLGIDKPRGPLWILFTPPKTPIHTVFEYAEEAKKDGSYAEYDITKGEYTPEVIELFKKEAGGENSTTWRREYLCQAIVDANYLIIPEFKPEEHVREYVKDEYYGMYHKYVAMDIGVRDKTIDLFGTYDFKQARMYIEDEIWFSGPQMTTKVVADGITSKERELWDKLPVRLRISDNNNLILLQDLGLLHGIHFSPTGKDTLEAMVNELRLWVARGRIHVNPKCSQLIGCLKYGVWNDKRTEWERSTVYGHFDGLAALMYLVRNIDQATNPIPKHYGVDRSITFIPPNEREDHSGNAAALRQALGVGKGKR